ncbi:hypothetical protein [Streptomyces sp. NPDC001933]|uniref:hypothetical protein n=1 Tax=Streptomyces sp. NPDC001933 TaxID=3364626 RepID=UPI003698E69E
MQNEERERGNVSAAGVSAYAAVMRRDANSARLRAEGAALVYDPGDESREAALHREIHEDEEVVAVRVVGGTY